VVEPVAGLQQPTRCGYDHHHKGGRCPVAEAKILVVTDVAKRVTSAVDVFQEILVLLL